MRDLLLIRDIVFVPGSSEQVTRGLLGFVSCTLNGEFRVDGLMICRDQDGGVRLKFPTRKDAEGRHHPIIKPLGRLAHADVQGQVLAELRRQGVQV